MFGVFVTDLRVEQSRSTFNIEHITFVFIAMADTVEELNEIEY